MNTALLHAMSLYDRDWTRISEMVNATCGKHTSPAGCRACFDRMEERGEVRIEDLLSKEPMTESEASNWESRGYDLVSHYHILDETQADTPTNADKTSELNSDEALEQDDDTVVETDIETESTQDSGEDMAAEDIQNFPTSEQNE